MLCYINNIEKKWNDNFELLKQYVLEYKKIPPSNNQLYNDVKLGEWASRQRRNYNKKKLSKDRINKLESIDYWMWNITSETWNNNFELLKQYVIEYNKIPPSNNQLYKNVRLGKWVTRQRLDYNKKKLSKDKINKLECVNFWIWKEKKINHKENFNKEKEKIINLYYKYGIKALSYKWLCDNGYKSLYNNIVIGKGGYKIKLEDLSKELKIHNEWKNQRHILQVKDSEQLWTPDNFYNITKELIKEYGTIPAAEFLRNKGYGSYISYMYSNNIKMEDLQKEHNFKKTKWISKNDMFWLSHAECCLANFLYSRGIEIKNGEKYPKEYNLQTNRKYGIYDLHFKGKINEYENKWISVEVWGDKPNGHSEIEYSIKRKQKELFHINDSLFLGISYKICYNEKSLEELLKKYIGVINPYIFKDERDKLFKTTQWTILDIVIKDCKYIMDNNNNILPPEGWFRLRKKSKYENRIINDWEKNIKTNLNTLSVYIKQCGGIRKIRKTLNCYNESTIEWNKDKIIKNMNEIYNRYSLPPYVIYNRLEKKIIINNDEILLKKKCLKIYSATKRHFDNGYKEACIICDIPIKRRWNNKLIL